MPSLNMLEYLRKEQLNQLLGSQERIQFAENCSSDGQQSTMTLCVIETVIKR
jgi:hypothetical protein